MKKFALIHQKDGETILGTDQYIPLDGRYSVARCLDVALDYAYKLKKLTNKKSIHSVRVYSGDLSENHPISGFVLVLPKNMETVVIKQVIPKRNAYGYPTKEKQEVTRLAFYSNSNGRYNSKDEWVDLPLGCFHVPQFWKKIIYLSGKVELAPDGWYSHGYVKPSDISPWRFSTKADEDFFIKNGNR